MTPVAWPRQHRGTPACICEWVQGISLPPGNENVISPPARYHHRERTGRTASGRWKPDHRGPGHKVGEYKKKTAPTGPVPSGRTLRRGIPASHGAIAACREDVHVVCLPRLAGLTLPHLFPIRDGCCRFATTTHGDLQHKSMFALKYQFRGCEAYKALVSCLPAYRTSGRSVAEAEAEAA